MIVANSFKMLFFSFYFGYVLKNKCVNLFSCLFIPVYGLTCHVNDYNSKKKENSGIRLVQGVNEYAAGE